MFDRFNGAGRRIFAAARARRFPADAEEILIAVLRERDTELGEVLASLDVDADALADEVARRTGSSDPWRGEPGRELSLRDFTLRASCVLGAAIAEASTLRHSEAGPAHLLLGLTRVHDGVVGRVLAENVITTARARAIVKRRHATQITRALPVECPRGHAAMDTVEREGVVLSVCPECVGTFFAPGELEALFARLAGRTGLDAESLRSAVRSFLDPPARAA